MGIRELRKLASSLKIKNYSKMKKAELEAAVKLAQDAAPTEPVAESKPVVKHSEQPAKASLPNALQVAGRAVVGNEIDGKPAVEVLASMNKGDARKLRKALFAAGRRDLASLDVRKATSRSVAAA